jgi:hypothetical protein
VQVLGGIIFLMKILGKVVGAKFVDLFLEGNTKIYIMQCI